MPRCEGLPSGPCPKSANNRHVKLSQGDLMLCSHCEYVCFPYVRKQTCAAPASTTVSTATAAVTAAKKLRGAAGSSRSSSSTSQDHEANCCPVCNDMVSENCIKCDICSCEIHGGCAGLDDGMLSKLLSLIQFTGWVCTDCRTNCRQKIDNLQSALAQLTEKLSDVMSTVDSLQQKLETHVSNSLTNVSDVPEVSKSNIALEVHRTLAESSVRKQNIVITGLPESADVGLTDERAFLALCEENFSVKPVLSHLGCQRLGKASEQYKSRKLLVHLRSEKVARDVLAQAKKLRKSDNAVVSSGGSGFRGHQHAR